MRISRLLVRRGRLGKGRIRRRAAGQQAAPAPLVDLLCARLPSGAAGCALDHAGEWFEALMAELEGPASSEAFFGVDGSPH